MSKPVRGVKKTRLNYSADFETTTDPNDCRVWLWGYVEIGDNEESLNWGTDIESFIDSISTHNSNVYFHNLKFDGHFILDYLLKNGYEAIDSSENKPRAGQLTGLISDMNKFYSLTVVWFNGHTTEFRDSLKKFNMPVYAVAKSFDLPESKGEIDYHKPRPIGYKPTEDELDYLRRDVTIIGKALSQVFDAGMTRLTVAADSLAEYKNLTGSKLFSRRFPVLSDDIDAEIRRAYRGGFTYADDRFMSSKQGGGIVLDVNSLYPSIMVNRLLPYGVPNFHSSKVPLTEDRPLSIFSVTFTAKLKPNHIPCIQIKGSMIFGATEYIKRIDEPVTLMVTNVDWKLYNDHYDIDVLSWGGGWSFSAALGMFDDYVTKWSAVKENSTGGRKQIAKLHLNSLYGKFATNPDVTGKVPYIEDDRVKFERGEPATRSPIYTAVGVFITSWARDLTIRAAQASYPVFAYADTDSLHLLTDTVPEGIEVHPTKLGAWKMEYEFTESFYARAKAYLELKKDGTYHVAWAGLPEGVSSQLTFDHMVDGSVLHGKLQPKSVPGGVVLEDVTYTLKL